jgi:hypothetical protein
MKTRARFAGKWLAIAAGVFLVVGVIAPYLSGNRFAPRIRAALESVLGRKVDLGPVHFSLFSAPGFSVDNVVIHENPAIGVEPVAYVGSLEAVPRLTSLFGGRLDFASIRLEDASINLTKSGAPSEPGHWNFEPLLNASVIRAMPELHVRSGRINFKFGDTKSVFYLMGTDLDITPPARGSGDWSIEFAGQPARTDKPARGFGNFMARGHWTQAGGGRLDLDVRLEKSAVGEMIALLHGYDAGVHGTVSARMHLSGPLDNIRIAGSMEIQDVHRWDLMPPYGGGWPFSLAGRLNVPAQILELSSSSGGGALPLLVQMRCSNYLSQPRWGAALNWNGFPIGPLLELARHMGVSLPPTLKMDGKLDGVLGYSGQGSLQGALSFHDASIAIPDSPPLKAREAHLIFDRGHARLVPTQVLTVRDEEAMVQADYNWARQDLSLTISTDEMRVDSLRAQAALAAVPWLEQVPNGTWSGQLAYRFCPPDSAGCAASRIGWTGNIQLREASFPLPGLAVPVQVQSAAARINGPWVKLDQIRAKCGDIAFQGEYSYEPQLTRPHRLRIQIPYADAGALERVFMPSLRRNRSLLARALSLGRTSVPDWLTRYHVDATVQIGSLHLTELDINGMRAHLLWDVTKAELDDIHARLDGGRVTGKLSVNLRGSRPSYRLEAVGRGIEWKSGQVDADAVLESAGTGAELLGNLHSSGTFVAQGLEMDALPDLETVSGAYDLAWAQPAPQLRFSDLEVISGEETYIGKGGTQPDGRLLIQLASGDKKVRMSGTLAELELEEPEARQ